MERKERVALSAMEKSQLTELKDELYGTQSVPYGRVVEDLARFYWQNK